MLLEAIRKNRYNLAVFRDRYRAAYAALGVPLTSSHALEADRLTALSELGLPDALWDYYAVAGNEHRFNHSFNRLLAPEDIVVQDGRIVFMEENQAAVLWGVNPNVANPFVEQGINSDTQPLEWHSEDVACAEFCETMLYVQATFGEALGHVVSAVVPSDFERRLETQFQSVGRIGTLSAYAPEGCALTFMPWSDDEWCVFGGFHTLEQKRAIARELELCWEDL